LDKQQVFVFASLGDPFQKSNGAGKNAIGEKDNNVGELIDI
jgi:hypothetical protein